MFEHIWDSHKRSSEHSPMVFPGPLSALAALSSAVPASAPVHSRSLSQPSTSTVLSTPSGPLLCPSPTLLPGPRPIISHGLITCLWTIGRQPLCHLWLRPQPALLFSPGANRSTLLCIPVGLGLLNHHVWLRLAIRLPRNAVCVAIHLLVWCRAVALVPALHWSQRIQLLFGKGLGFLQSLVRFGMVILQ